MASKIKVTVDEFGRSESLRGDAGRYGCRLAVGQEVTVIDEHYCEQSGRVVEVGDNIITPPNSQSAGATSYVVVTIDI